MDPSRASRSEFQRSAQFAARLADRSRLLLWWPQTPQVPASRGYPAQVFYSKASAASADPVPGTILRAAPRRGRAGPAWEARVEALATCVPEASARAAHAALRRDCQGALVVTIL